MLRNELSQRGERNSATLRLVTSRLDPSFKVAPRGALFVCFQTELFEFRCRQPTRPAHGFFWRYITEFRLLLDAEADRNEGSASFQLCPEIG